MSILITGGYEQSMITHTATTGCYPPPPKPTADDFVKWTLTSAQHLYDAYIDTSWVDELPPDQVIRTLSIEDRAGFHQALSRFKHEWIDRH